MLLNLFRIFMIVIYNFILWMYYVLIIFDIGYLNIFEFWIILIKDILILVNLF